MKPLAVLLATFLLALLLCYWIQGAWNYFFAGNIAMAAMLLFTAMAHFVYRHGMEMMIPSMVPGKTAIVYFTGIMEILFAAGLCVPSTRRLAADLLILFFLLILPANVNAAQKSVDYQNATFEGRGVGYLWLRIPLQIFFIFWTAYFGIILQPE